MHKIAQVGAGSRASSIPERLLLIILNLFLLLFFSYPFDDSDSVALTDINVHHSSTARHRRDPVGFHAAIATEDHSGHSGSLPRIIIAAVSSKILVVAGCCCCCCCSAVVDEKRIDSTPRRFVRHPSLSSHTKLHQHLRKPRNQPDNAETIGRIFSGWMDGWMVRASSFYHFAQQFSFCFLMMSQLRNGLYTSEIFKIK